MRTVIMIIVLFVAAGFILPEKQNIRIFMAGDSTMSIKEVRVYPENGWGMPFVHFWDSSVKVENRARNGRSTRTFISEGLWQSIMNDIRPGDHVLIQFGHNDEAKEKTERYTTPDEFKNNLRKFVTETRSKNGKPWLLSPVSRRRFDANGKIIETHPEYTAATRLVAVELQVPYIDADSLSRELLQSFGKDLSRLLFLQLKPGEHPNYPDGRDDNTHFNELGARLVAQLILKEIRKMDPELASRIVNREVKK